MSVQVQVVKVWRETSTDRSMEALDFTAGLNLLVGPPNVGKSKWLQTLDFVLGDVGTVEAALGAEVASRYNRMGANLKVGPESWNVERRLEQGTRTKVLVNGRDMSPAEFSQLLLDALGIRRFRFPRGDPTHSDWVELSWRMLFRHVYRNENSWNEIAAKQPDYEQHAAMSAFLGVSGQLYPEQNEALVRRREDLQRLEARRQQFGSTLDAITREVLLFDELARTVSAEAIDATVTRLSASRLALEARKADVLAQIAPTGASDREAIDRLGEELAAARQRWHVATQAVSDARGRLTQLVAHAADLDAEISRWRRAEVAGRVLGPIKVTHCPVCDQAVRDEHRTDECYLCGRPFVESLLVGSKQRVDFERVQLDEERSELDSLIGEAHPVIDAAEAEGRAALDQVRRLEAALRPLSAPVTAALPPELALLDQEIGRVDEQIRQTERIRRVLDLGTQLTRELDSVREQIAVLESEAASRQARESSVGQATEILANGINAYLSALGTTRWPEGAVTCEVRARSIGFRIGGENWSSKLGATLKAYFVLAYQYGLLTLAARDEFLFPGLVVLDFPPSLAEKPLLPAGSENYLLEPFVSLQTKQSALQVIVAAGDVSLPAAKRMELTEVWR